MTFKKPVKLLVLACGLGLIASIGLWGYSRIENSGVLRGVAFYVFLVTVLLSLLPLVFASVVILTEKVRGPRQ